MSVCGQTDIRLWSTYTTSTITISQTAQLWLTVIRYSFCVTYFNVKHQKIYVPLHLTTYQSISLSHFYLRIDLSIYPFIYPSIYLSVYPSIYINICTCLYWFMYYSSTYLTMCLTVYIAMHIYMYLCMHLCTSLHICVPTYSSTHLIWSKPPKFTARYSCNWRMKSFVNNIWVNTQRKMTLAYFRITCYTKKH
jgi:hypothetical protein